MISKEDKKQIRIEKRFITVISRALTKAHKRDNPRPQTISVSELVAIGKATGWRCALSGQPLEYVRGGDFVNNSNPNILTLDRIDNDLGYISGNVQLVTWCANYAKGSMHNSVFIEMCKYVSAAQGEKA